MRLRHCVPWVSPIPYAPTPQRYAEYARKCHAASAPLEAQRVLIFDVRDVRIRPAAFGYYDHASFENHGEATDCVDERSSGCDSDSGFDGVRRDVHVGRRRYDGLVVSVESRLSQTPFPDRLACP